MKDIEFVTDLGPEILHYYEISNFGPFDVGNVIVSQSITQFGAWQTLMTNVQVNVSWPLKTTDGDWLLYLTEAPVIKVSQKR